MSPPGTPPIEAVAFDVNETLFALDRLRPAFTDAGLDPQQVPVWFARLLRDGFALTALGGYRPFAEVAAETLRGLDPTVDDDAVAIVTTAMRHLDPHPDVQPALRTLHDAGVPLATLTNGSVDVAQALLQRAGLSGYLTRILSVDAVRRWKPAPEPYRYAATELAVTPAALVLVAAHPWDCAGAAAAGLRPAWVNRPGDHWPQFFPTPEFSAPDLTTLAETLLATRRH
ncbi:haloacid dehalogenase type II [Micromonospora sp. NPDC006431]|uniref:haloacid dehalogenase type II n=1 Tax=Micromonospora sp. NPDC006431 TaxID=3364235 RepID=UPI00368A2553